MSLITILQSLNINRSVIVILFSNKNENDAVNEDNDVSAVI